MRKWSLLLVMIVGIVFILGSLCTAKEEIPSVVIKYDPKYRPERKSGRVK